MQKGQIVILGGTPRAGKTTLANKLAHSGFSKISFDALSDALQKGFPEIVISDWTNQEICAAKKYPFFESLIESAVHDSRIYGLNTVIDQYDFTPEYISRLPFQSEVRVYYLGYPHFTVEEIRYNIRHYAQPSDWIAQVDEDYLLVVAERCFEVNEKLASQCKTYGVEFIDTSAGDARDKALEDLYRRIVGNE